MNGHFETLNLSSMLQLALNDNQRLRLQVEQLQNQLRNQSQIANQPSVVIIFPQPSSVPITLNHFQQQQQSTQGQERHQPQPHQPQPHQPQPHQLQPHQLPLLLPQPHQPHQHLPHQLQPHQLPILQPLQLQPHQPQPHQPQPNQLQPEPRSTQTLVSYFDASRPTKYRITEDLRQDFRRINEKLHQRGLSFQNTVISEKQSSFPHDVSVRIRPIPTTDPIEPFLIKDTENISNRKYNRIRATSGWPSLYQARLFKERIDNMFPIKRNEFGVYNDVKSKLHGMANRHKQQLHLLSNKLLIKLGSDGAFSGSKFKFLNFTFSFLNHFNSNGFVDANFTLGIFDIVNEDYFSVKNRFFNLLNELSRVNSVSISDKEYQVEYFFAADLKMLALVLGVNAANSVCPCPFCKCPVNEFYDTSKVWSITDPKLGARTMDNIEQSIGTDGQKEVPIVNFIPFFNFVPDLLHMNLRISEVLFEHFFTYLVQLDWIEKTKRRQKLFLNFLVEEIRIYSPVYEKGKKLCLKSFSRDENLKILSSMPLMDLFPDVLDVFDIQNIWRGYHEICVALIRNLWDSEQIKEKTKNWLDLLCGTCTNDIVTLYMHVLQQHVHQFHELHGDVNRFNCQMLEKKNHLNTKNLFGSTNLHTNLTENDDCLVQLVKKNNRLDYLNRFADHAVSSVVRRVNRRRRNFIANFRKKTLFN